MVFGVTACARLDGGAGAGRALDPAMREWLNQVDASPCAEVINNEVYPVPTRDCVPLSARRAMRGIWRPGLEDSTFVPDNPDPDMIGERVWLEMEPSDALRNGVIQSENMLPYGTFAIRFVGRRSLHRGEYGHFGGWQHVVVVDRVISVRRIRDRNP